MNKTTKKRCILNEGEIFGEEAFMNNLELDP